MSVEIDIRNALLADPDLSAIVGDKVSIGMADQNTAAPYVNFFRPSTTPQNVLNGPHSLERVRIQFDCYAETYGGAKRLYSALENAINDSGLGGKLQNKFDRVEEGADLMGVTADFYFWETK